MKAMSTIYYKQDLICSCIKLTPDPGTHGFLNKTVSALNLASMRQIKYICKKYIFKFNNIVLGNPYPGIIIKTTSI